VFIRLTPPDARRPGVLSGQPLMWQYRHHHQHRTRPADLRRPLARRTRPRQHPHRRGADTGNARLTPRTSRLREPGRQLSQMGIGVDGGVVVGAFGRVVGGSSSLLGVNC
jgi:hypothetical protein